MHAAKLLSLATFTILAIEGTCQASQPPGFEEESRSPDTLVTNIAPAQLVAQFSGRQGEAYLLFQQGLRQLQSSQFRAALQSWEQALAIYREIENRFLEGRTLNNLAVAHNRLGQYEQAISLLEQQLIIARELNDRSGEGDALGNLGAAYYYLGQPERAIDLFEQQLSIARELSNRSGEGSALTNLGRVYYRLGQYHQAIDFFEQQLSIARELGNQTEEGSALGNLGSAYRNLDQYERAISLHEQYLNLAREIGDRSGEGNALNNLGNVYQVLGQYERAISLYKQDLSITRELGDRSGEGRTLGNLGSVHNRLGQYEQAIGFLEQQLSIARELGDRAGEGMALGNLGHSYYRLGQPEQAIDLFEQDLSIARELGDRDGEARTLGNLGYAYHLLGQNQRAIGFYEQALAIFRDIGNRTGEGWFLSYLGQLFNDQEQPELAVIFLKASVTVRETIRDGIRNLDAELQQAYTDTVADDYRLLADLLLEQGRIPEAQQVLDLLKLEELRKFTDTTRAAWNGNSLQYSDPEQAVIDAHGSLVALGGEVIACEDSNCAELESLYDRLESLKAQYDQQVSEFEATVQANRSDDPVFQDLDNLSGDAEALLAAYAADGQKALLIYPFVLEDKLWLVYAAAGNVIGSVEVAVSQRELATAVQQLGARLTRPKRLDALQAASHQLYDWIIRPLETELAANDIDHLVFVNDRVTRYIPMAVLYDGSQYLMERFTVSTVLTPGLTDMNDRLTEIEQPQILGLGLTQPVANFSALPAVDAELDAIVRSGTSDEQGIYPGSVFLNDAFTLNALKANVRRHRVLHMATHAAFVPGRAEESFIVLGNGERLRVGDIEAMERRLSNLHLVVLSACQTALGGEAGDGTEIAGISSYFLEKGRAETVIASLWSVNDNSTSILMQRFYELLASGELSKAEALQQAQLSLLYDEDVEARLTASRNVSVPGAGIKVNAPTDGYRHPYYWAPFILIGNGR